MNKTCGMEVSSTVQGRSPDSGSADEVLQTLKYFWLNITIFLTSQALLLLRQSLQASSGPFGRSDPIISRKLLQLKSWHFMILHTF